jgi:hypothetical protein
MSIFGVMGWSFLSGLALGVLDAISYSASWRWLLGG